jgi:hypothetical protein
VSALTVATTDLLPESGSFGGDVVAVAIAILTFAILYWAIDLFDRV